MQRTRSKAENIINEWLDDEGESSRKSKKKKAFKQAQFLDPSEANATVIQVFPKQCQVLMDEDEQSVLCQYRRNRVFQNDRENYREKTPVAIGDRVKVERLGRADGIVDGIAERKNQFERQASGKDEGFVHVLACNVDRVVIVAAVEDPHFSPGLVDRFLVTASKNQVDVTLAINKVDLRNSPGAEERPWALYETLGVKVFEVSAKQRLGIEALRASLTKQTVLFCGHSGVGKTSLLRALLEEDVGKVGGVNAATGKGRHTTTGSRLYLGPGHSKWIDTPGIRAFGLVGIEPKDLLSYFPELCSLTCAQTGCLHDGTEERCTAKEMPRYESYQRILISLKDE